MKGNPPLGPTGHADTFTRDNLPPADLWPEIDLGPFQYPEYLNAAATIETDLQPDELLAVLKDVERRAGRETDSNAPAYVRDGPRAIDLDIALLGGLVHDTDLLTVPHPRLLERRFALIPLLELDAELATPDGRRLADALAALPVAGQDVRRVD